MTTSVFEAYSWNALLVLDQCLEASYKLGTCRHAIDVGSSSYRGRLDYLKSVLRARLEGKTPPFDRRARVKANTVYCPYKIFGDPNLGFTPGTKHALKEGDICTVHSMHYQDGQWMVALCEHNVNEQQTTYFLYDAKNLELVP